jgi:hypothetical protein
MADSTLTIRIVTQKDLNSGNTPATGMQGASTPPASAPQTSSPVQQNQNKTLTSLAVGMLATQGFSTLTHALGTIPGQSRTASRLGNIGGGAISGASAGAAFGPIGMAAGALIGGTVGALKTLADEAKETRDALRTLKDAAKMTGLTTGAKRQDEAFLRKLQWLTPTERGDAISARAIQIKHGKGELSIENLTSSLEKMAKAGQIDTPEYKEKSRLLDMQKSRLATLGELDDKNFFQTLPNLVKGSDYADSLQKIGGVIGPTIDVKDTNREMIDLLREISFATRTLATARVDTKGGLDNSSGPNIFLP